MTLSLILAAAIGLGHYLSEKFCIACTKYKGEVISFTAGVSITYIFLQLLPELYFGVSELDRSLFVFVLIGFSLFHLIEKYIYQNEPRKKISDDLIRIHSIGLTIYYLVLGIVLVKFINKSTTDGILFFAPVFLHTIVASLSTHGIHGVYGHHHKSEKWSTFIQSIAALVGVIIALTVTVTEKVSFALTGLVAGLLLYIVIRDLLPKGKKGAPLFFLLGAVIYSAIIIALWGI
ncbi:MAG: hypothetical protein QF824_04830 [Candidatus Woesearchaeota archaeon]|nr:hypothetical protein [Candidatus Woesearchaeota archaeon]